MSDNPLKSQEIEEALKIFDETTRALESRARRLEEVLTVKQAELQAANQRLQEKVAELDAVHAYVNLVLNSVTSGVVAMNASGAITACNPAAQFLLARHNADELIGRHYNELMPVNFLQEVLEQGQVIGPWERSCQSLDGQERRLAGRSNPIQAADGSILGVVETFEDVTEVRRLEEQLERAERLKALGEMAAGVAHEIRNPLNGIEGFASLLGRDCEAGSKQEKYTNCIIDGVRHLNATVTGLLAFTSPKPPQKYLSPVYDICQSCVDLVDAEDSGRQGTVTATNPVPIHINDACADERIECDPHQLRQVILNLMQNACQILRQHEVTDPRVQVLIERHRDSCHIHVDDNGPGVPEADRHHIFTPFHTKREEGTGLGLAVAHTIISLHGGELTVADSDLGGARFSISLPAQGYCYPM